MNRFYLILFVSCLAHLPQFLSAQKEGNIWVVGNSWGGAPGYAVNFNTQPPSIDSGFQIEYPYLSSICDSAGNLLFYTEGQYIHNAQHMILNGQPLAPPAIQAVSIVPQPKSKKYYVITTWADGLIAEKRFTVVDMSLNNGSGGIVGTPQTFSTTGQDWHVASKGYCNGQYYWVIISDYVPGTNQHRLLAYKIDENGLNLQPVISTTQSTQAFGIRFSPGSDKIAFYGSNVVFLADFNRETGVISNEVPLNLSYGDFDFSPSGRYLYHASLIGISAGQPGDFLYSVISQLDLEAGSYQAIINSKTIVYQGSQQTGNGVLGTQVGPDGRVYFYKSRPDLYQPSLSAILFPEVGGTGCTYVQDLILLPSAFPNGYAIRAPFLPANFFDPGRFTVAAAEYAGADAVVCPDEVANLGTPPVQGYSYGWLATDYLSDPQAPQTSFLFPGPLYQDTTLFYIRSSSLGKCTYEDTVAVRVERLPLPPQIGGSRSVCPRVVGVEYWINQPQDSVTYEWTVNGGTLVSGQGSDSIRVDWGPYNNQASISVRPRLPNGCDAPEVYFPVRINPELDTETPRGPDSLCAEARTNVPYGITRTNGSVYTWGCAGADIASGQGSAQIALTFPGAGLYKLWVQEQSVTIDTICYGVSDTLYIEVFTDTSKVQLVSVSTLETDERQIEVRWNKLPHLRPLSDLNLWRRSAGGNWQQVAALPGGSSGSYTDGPLDTDAQTFEYQIFSSNECRTDMPSDTHRSILLEGEGDTLTDEIRLSWTPYEGWPVNAYVIYRQLDGESSLQAVDTVAGNVLSMVYANGLDGFVHRYRIKALAAQGAVFSWSNDTVFEFRHPVFIPNVFTPNGDVTGERWVVEKLERYPENHVLILDRWGRKVFEQPGYQNDWRGEGLPEGVYFYSLVLKPGDAAKRGSLTLLR
ncbi:MAG: gliding motility-associated C-terminal domain-containing protein [Bacteroidetes bacterium]|nr:MAG: gliding motility-associated C-terminal domain-containing protein [Bacteroidota bacterium]